MFEYGEKRTVVMKSLNFQSKMVSSEVLLLNYNCFLDVFFCLKTSHHNYDSWGFLLFYCAGEFLTLRVLIETECLVQAHLTRFKHPGVIRELKNESLISTKWEAEITLLTFASLFAALTAVAGASRCYIHSQAHKKLLYKHDAIGGPFIWHCSGIISS